MTPAPFLIALPSGLIAGGVTTWAVRLLNALAAQGRPVGLILHHPTPGHEPVDVALHPAVDITRIEHAPPLDTLGGDFSRVLPPYRAALRRLAARSALPVVFSPNLVGDCYALAAALCLVEPDSLRVAGWCHLQSAYDLRVLERYAPVIARFAAVSDRLEADLRARLPARAAHIRNVPYGVETPPAPPRRDLLPGRPLRLAYPGRIDADIKRIRVLVLLSDELRRRGIAHELTMMGDGPAVAEIDAACRDRPGRLRRLPAAGAAAVVHLLERSDAFILPSRAEGLSVAMLEAMARACVPVVTRVGSGAAQAIRHRENGLLIDTPPDVAATNADTADATLALAFADELQALTPAALASLGHAAWETIRDRFTLAHHVDAARALIDDAAASPARAWHGALPVAFTGIRGGSGSVPADAAPRLRALLASLAGRRVALHGTGQHTIELAPILAEFHATIAGFTDDDPKRHGATLWGWPIVPPADAPSLGATDVLISSWMHQESIWHRRATYERAAIRVHRLYPTP